MPRPVFDTASLWDSLTAEQQRAIGIAAIDREIVIHGRDEIDGPMFAGDFDALDHDAEDRLLTAVSNVLDLASIDAAEFPLPAFAGRT